MVVGLVFGSSGTTLYSLERTPKRGAIFTGKFRTI